MDSFELNKIMGAILGTLLFVMGVGFVAEAIYTPTASGPGYALPGEEAVTEGTGTTEVAEVADLGTLLAAADPKNGEALIKKCASCHDFTSGGPNKAGPNLYDIVDRPIASHEGFAYSDALKSKSTDTWTYEHLDAWLTSPKGWAPGTKMTYAGDKDAKERADMIAYLATLSASPKPFPAPKAPEGGEQPTSSQVVDNTSSAAEPASSSAEAAPAAPASSSAEAAPAASSAEAAPASSEAPAAPASSSEAPAVPASSSEVPAMPAMDASSSSSAM